MVANKRFVKIFPPPPCHVSTRSFREDCRETRNCLRDSLIRDRLVIGINDNATQKKLLQDRKLTLTKAIDICRSSETTKKQVKKIQANSEANEGEINAIVNNKTETGSTGTGRRDDRRIGLDRRDRGRDNKIKCKYCGTMHQRKKELCPAFGGRCRNCGRENNFAKVCIKKGRYSRQKPLHAVTANDSSDSGDSLMTVELAPPRMIPSIQYTNRTFTNHGFLLP